MNKVKDKVKKKRINWREVLFFMHNKYLSDCYTLMLGDHPKTSHNRIAYYVLKKYCTTSTLKFLRNLFVKSTMTEEEVVQWYRFYVRGELKDEIR